MDNQNINPTPKDEKLWALAKKRAKFKKHLVSYIIVNGLLWVVWAFSGHLGSSYFDGYREGFHFPWPVIIMFFWGIGLFFDFFNAYFGSVKPLEEKEYQKLIDKKDSIE